jgi:hypothetical protein
MYLDKEFDTIAEMLAGSLAMSQKYNLTSVSGYLSENSGKWNASIRIKETVNMDGWKGEKYSEDGWTKRDE